MHLTVQGGLPLFTRHCTHRDESVISKFGGSGCLRFRSMFVIIERNFERISFGRSLSQEIPERHKGARFLINFMAYTTPSQKLLILCTASNIGGMERVACGLARAFIGRGWNARLVFSSSAKVQDLLEWCRDQEVNAEATTALRDVGASHSGRDMINLVRFVRAEDPNVINLHYGDNFISLKDVLAVRFAGLLTRRRCIITVHHPTPWGKDNAQKRLMTRLAVYLAHQVIVVSSATRDILLEAGIPKSRIKVISNGLRPPESKLSAADARARLGLPSSAFIVGCLGRLVSHKGIDDLIKAAAQLPLDGPETLIAIAGSGPEREPLEKLAMSLLNERGIVNIKVKFLGRIPDVDEFYAACDVFALPSHLEGFGLVYVEAAFHGVPSVGARAGGVVDVIVDGESGFLVPPGDPAALAVALQRLREDPALCRRLGDTAKERAYAQFTEEVMAEQYRKAFV